MGRIGRFYAANTAGAVLGVLLASFYLLRVHDTVVATFAAVALNAAVAVAALGLAASIGRVRGPAEGGAEPPVAKAPVRNAAAGPGAGATPAPAAAAGPAALAVIFLSGFAALGAEVVWTRQLSLLFGATVYNFSLILAVFLAGIGLGSAGAPASRPGPTVPARRWRGVRSACSRPFPMPPA